MAAALTDDVLMAVAAFASIPGIAGDVATEVLGGRSRLGSIEADEVIILRAA